ncbi:hypothetical protein FB451DRAFT_1535021 [Mycena latifolia]|nr:hypothetical protein FB451DRAFT_1535021 [Mycena latifolia]
MRSRAHDAPATFPRLPDDLERMIFELVAWEDPKTVPALVRVAKRTLFWFEPLLYRVLVLRDDPTAIARIHDLLAQKSDSLWRSSPHHLFLGLAIPAPAATDALLRKCTAIYDLLLYCGPAPSQNFLPQLAALPLRRLAIDMHHLFSNLPALDVRPPTFAHLTHLLLIDILDAAPAAAEPWAAQLARLPRLTHLAFLATAGRTVQPRALLRAVLRQCAGLRVLVALHVEYRKMTAQKLQRKLRVTDARFVIMPFATLAEDWEMGARGGADFWARADAFIDARARGEIDALNPKATRRRQEKKKKKKKKRSIVNWLKNAHWTQAVITYLIDHPKFRIKLFSDSTAEAKKGRQKQVGKEGKPRCMGSWRPMFSKKTPVEMVRYAASPAKYAPAFLPPPCGARTSLPSQPASLPFLFPPSTASRVSPPPCTYLRARADVQGPTCRRAGAEADGPQRAGSREDRGGKKGATDDASGRAPRRLGPSARSPSAPVDLTPAYRQGSSEIVPRALRTPAPSSFAWTPRSAASPTGASALLRLRLLHLGVQGRERGLLRLPSSLFALPAWDVRLRARRDPLFLCGTVLPFIPRPRHCVQICGQA